MNMRMLEIMGILQAKVTAAAVLALAAALPLTGLAQESEAQRHLRDGLASVAAGDTAAAIAEFQKATEADSKLVEAYVQLGRLYTRRASWKETDFGERRLAEKALERALDLDANNPWALAELGYLRIKQHMKLAAGRILGRALKLAEGQADSAMLSEIHYNAGYIHEMEYERLRDKYFIPPHRGPIDTRTDDIRTSPWLTRDIDEYLRNTARIEGSGSADAEEMMAHYRAALLYAPGHFEASRRLMLVLLDRRQLEDYLLLAYNLVRTNPDRPEAQLYLGLGLHMAGREDEAAAAFELGLAALPERERAIFSNIEPTLRSEPGEAYMQLEDTARGQFEESYWRLGDPLFLTAANEKQLEHLARVAYADLRFSEPATGRRGWETDRGIIYIRYGSPINVFRAGAIVWQYGNDGPVFMFNQTPGYNRTLFAGDYRGIAQDYRFIQPSIYTRIPSIPELYEIPVQLARFRGPSSAELAVEVHARLPLELLTRGVDLGQGEIEAGLFILTSRGQRVVEQTYTEIVEYDDVEERRSWRVILPGGGLLVAAVEAREASSWAAAVSRDTFTAALFHKDGSPKISDILLGDDIRELKREPRVRTDYDIRANPAREYESGQPVHLYWEIYDLEQDDQGFASYDVALQVKINELHREGTIAQLLGGLADAWGFSVAGDDQLELRFNRQVDMTGRDRVTEYLRLDLKEAPGGEYEIRLRVWDRIAEQLTSQVRAFTVTDTDS